MTKIKLLCKNDYIVGYITRLYAGILYEVERIDRKNYGDDMICYYYVYTPTRIIMICDDDHRYNKTISYYFYTLKETRMIKIDMLIDSI